MVVDKEIQYICLYCATILATLGGCSQEELISATTEETLNISVVDGGYTLSGDEDMQTRVTENNYYTEFTTGDKIGVYVVKNNEIVTGGTNVCLTLTEDGSGNLIWMPERDVPFWNEGKDAMYYAYYPYCSDDYMVNKITVSADNTDDFFAGLINNWIPGKDQSDYVAYTASDLMMGSSRIIDGKVSFSLIHRMAMVVIELPVTRYQSTNPAIPDYIGGLPPDTKFDNGIIPYYSVKEGVCRYLQRPAVETEISGSYTNSSILTNWMFTTRKITGGCYSIYVVDGGMDTQIIKTHTL